MCDAVRAALSGVVAVRLTDHEGVAGEVNDLDDDPVEVPRRLSRKPNP